jgi:hypothetical protein
MRVRISFDALRLCLLVAAGVTSGYLWRAAFESSSPVEARVASPPAIVERTPAPPVVRIVPHHLTTTKQAAPGKHVVSHPVIPAAHESTGTLIGSHVPSSQPVPTPPAATPPPASTPPKPTPPTPPAPTPAPATPPPPPTQTPTATATVASPPVQAAAPPPASSPSNEPNLGASQDDSRPGWGKGDDNHDHTGPGGKGK